MFPPFVWLQRLGDLSTPKLVALTAFFGDQRTFNGKRQSQHYGTDIRGATGTPVSRSDRAREPWRADRANPDAQNESLTGKAQRERWPRPTKVA